MKWACIESKKDRKNSTSDLNWFEIVYSCVFVVNALGLARNTASTF